MNSLKTIVSCSLILASSQAFSWGGPVMDSYGNRITTVTGECYYYGDIGPSACDTMKKDDMMKAAAPAVAPVTAPAPVAAPEPMASNEEPEVAEVIDLQGVNFETGSATLTSSSSIRLSQAANQLLKNPDVKVIVAGHTDNSGDALFNLNLSQQRAEAVKTYLVNKGVEPKNLTARGYGITQPVADNNTSSGRAQNRRVELRILK